MRPTISQVHSWDLGALAEAVQIVCDAAKRLDAALDAMARRIGDAHDWRGRTHDAVSHKVAEELDHGREVLHVLDRIGDDALDAARTLEHARGFALSAVGVAAAQGFSVADSGTVSDPELGRQADADYHEHVIGSALDDIERLDTRYGTALGDAVAELIAVRDGQPDIVLPTGELADPDVVVDRIVRMTPDERASYLATLTPTAIDALVFANPQAIGNLDGVPFGVRVAANAINVRNALIDAVQQPHPDAARVRQLEGMLEPIEDPSTSSVATDLVDRKFLAFSTEGNGRMIELIGDIRPGIAGVGVVVPGANTNLDSSGTNHSAAAELARQSGSPILLFLDGDFPQGLGEAAHADFAATMAPRLVALGREIDRAVADGAPGTPVTYIGHSYGGSIVGTAEQEGLRADRVVYASAAGTGIHATEWHDANPSVQRYSMTAPGDPIGLSQSAPYNPLGANTLGGDPDEVADVVRLDTGYYGATDPIHPGEVVFGLDGHGYYWRDPDSDAFHNLAKVIAGGDVTGYVARGIEADNVDVNIGDDGDFTAELYDVARAEAGVVVSGVELPGALPRIPTFDRMEDPYGHPIVTDNPGRGPAIAVTHNNAASGMQ